MKKARTLIITAFLFILLSAVLILVNRDIFHFTYDVPCQRTFTSEVDEKRDYIVNGPVTLKPGSYKLSLILTVEGSDNGVFLNDGDENPVFYSDMPDGTL